jgi:hypothetical protein
MNPVGLRQAIFTKLNVSSLTALLTTQYGGLPAVFHEKAPQADDSGSALYFPYVSFWQITDVGFNDKLTNGISALVQVDVWSRLDTTQCEAIAKAVYDLLHRQPLMLTGQFTTECESMDFQRDPDGKTRHGILRFRVLALA